MFKEGMGKIYGLEIERLTRETGFLVVSDNYTFDTFWNKLDKHTTELM